MIIKGKIFYNIYYRDMVDVVHRAILICLLWCSTGYTPRPIYGTNCIIMRGIWPIYITLKKSYYPSSPIYTSSVWN